MGISPLPTLRPKSLPELLDQAIHLYRQNFVKFVGIIAIPYIPLILIQGALSYITSDSLRGAPTFNPLLLASSFGSILFGIAQFFLVQGIATAALTRAVADVYTGQPIDIVNSYSRLKGAWGRLIFALLFMSMMLIGALIWFIVPCIGWLSGMGVLLFIGIVVFPLIAPVVVLENRGVIASVRRAWDLGRMRFWWLLGYGFIINLFGQMVVTGPVLIINAVLQGALRSGTIPLDQQLIWSTIVQTLVGMVTNLLYLPLQLTAVTVAYMDLRVRFEGLDLILQTAELTGAPTDSVFLPGTAASATTPFVTTKDMGFFILLSFAGVAVYAILVAVLFVPIVLLLASSMPGP